MKKSILILGGGGFIGGHLARRFLLDGHSVSVADIKEHCYFKKEEISNEFIQCDLRVDGEVKDLFAKEYDEVYQLAADVGGVEYISSGKHDAEIMRNNLQININVLKYCNSKIFFASSSCVYPALDKIIIEKDAYPASPENQYGWEKLVSERMYMLHNLNVRIGRFQNVFGSREIINTEKERCITAICRKVITSDKEVEIWGSGDQSRSFLYIDDCVDAVIRLMQNFYPYPINVSVDKSITMNELAKRIVKFSGKDLSIKNLTGEEFYRKYKFKYPDNERSKVASSELFTTVTGRPVMNNFDEGLRTTFNWIKENI